MGVGASWPLPGLYFPVLGRRVGRAAALSPWQRASAGPHAEAECAGWVPAASPMCSVERPQPVICRESWICALCQCLFLSQVGGLPVFVTVKGRSERER